MRYTVTFKEWSFTYRGWGDEGRDIADRLTKAAESFCDMTVEVERLKLERAKLSKGKGLF